MRLPDVGLLSITTVRDARIVNIVIPAEAGIHCLDGAKMDPRFRGDDASLAKTITYFGNSLKKQN
jgi:hypothetical protein